jgi:hypothetical protein
MVPSPDTRIARACARALRLACVLACVLASMVGAPSAASAAEYDVPACNWAAGGVNWSWTYERNDWGLFQQMDNCPTGDQMNGGIGGRNHTCCYGNTGATVFLVYRFMPPAGTAISGYNMDAWIKRSDAWNNGGPSPQAWSASVVAHGFGEAWTHHRGCTADTSYCEAGCLGCEWGWQWYGPRAWYLQLEIACSTDCENNREFARAQMYGVTVRVEDTGNPASWPNNGGGNVFGPGGYGAPSWVRGSRSLEFGNSDATGIRRSEVWIWDGGWVNTHAYNFGCEYREERPCGDNNSWYGLDTTTRSNGSHTIIYRGWDATTFNGNCCDSGGTSGNYGDWSSTIYIDNAAPTAPATVNDGGGADQEWVTSASAMTSNWSAGSDAHSGVRDYFQCFSTGGSCTGTNVGSGWTGATSASRVGMALAQGTRYYSCVYTRDNALDTAGNPGNTSGWACSNGQRVDSVAPSAPGTPTDAGSYQLATNALTASWGSAGDATSGVASYDYCISTAAGCGGTVVRTWSNVGAALTVNATGLALANGTTYYVAVRAIDVAGNVGPAASTDGMTIDTSANAPASVADGTGVDATWIPSASIVRANWPASTGEGSGINRYEYCISNAANCGGTVVQGWTTNGTSTSLTASGLSLIEGVQYFVAVRMVDNLATTSAVVSSNGAIVDSVAPPSPASVTAVSPTLVAPVVSWSSVTDATSGVAYWRIYRGTSSTGPWTQVNVDGATTGLTYTDGTAPFGTSWYRVLAVDAAGNVDAVGTVSGATIYHRAPNVPTLVSPTAGATGTSLLPTFTATHSDPDANTGVITFQLCANSGCTVVVDGGTSASVASGSNGSWTTATMLSPATTYWWRAMVADQYGASSAWSATQSFTTLPGPTFGDNQTGDLTWRNTNSGTYDIDIFDPLVLDYFQTNVWSAAGRSGTERQPWTLVSMLSGTSYTANWALQGSTWTAMAEGINFVSVRAWNTSSASGTLVDAFEVRKDTQAAAPGAVNDGAGADVAFWGSTGTLDANWTGSTGEVGMSGVLRYQYCIATGVDCTGTVARTWTNATAATSVTASGLALGDGITYRIAIRMVDAAGNTSAPTSSNGFLVDATPPSAPTLVTPADAAVVTSVPSLTATYVDPAPATLGRLNFQVCSNATCGAVVASGSTAAGIASGSNGSWTPGALAGATWWWRVSGTDSAGTTGAWSAIRSFVLTFPPTAATLVSPADTAWVASATPTLTARFNDPDAGATGQLTFETCTTSAVDPWSANCASGYQTGTSATGIATGSNGSWSTASIANGATRYWRARGSDGTSTGPWSAVRSVRVDTVAPPVVSTLTAPSPTSSAPVLTWSTVVDAESGTAFYRVYRSSSAGVIGAQVNTDGATTGGTWTQPAGLTSGTWYYTVRAVDAVGNERTIGNNQATVVYTAPIYFRSTASLATAVPSSMLLSRTPGSTADTSTSPRIARNQGCYIQFPAGQSPTSPPCPATLPTAPTGGGWLMNASPGDSFQAGTWRVTLTTTASRAHVGNLVVRAWKVTLAGGAIQAGATPISAWTTGATNIGASTAQTTSFVDVPTSAVGFGAGEYLYVEAWERLVTESGNNSTSVTLRVDTATERIDPTLPIPAFAVGGVTPDAAPQGRRDLVVQVAGSGFVNGATVAFGSGITVDSVTYLSSTALEATIDVSSAAALGLRDVVVTNPDTSTATAVGAFTVTAPTITVSFSTLGFTDLARTAVAPHSIDFGIVVPGAPRAIGPVGSGQALAGAAIETTVTSDTDWVLQASSTTWSDGATSTMIPEQLAWKHFGVSEPWTQMTATPTTTDGPYPPGTDTRSHDLQLSVPAAQLAGSYGATLSYTAIAAP